MIKNKIFNKVISIVLAVLTVVLGLLFVLQSIRLNNHYTAELITRVFMQILVVVILWGVVFVISLFTQTEEKKKPLKLKYFKKQVSDKTYLIINIVYSVIVLACAVFTFGYLVQDKHYSFEFNEDMLAIFYYLLPFVIVLLIASLVRAAFVPAPKRLEKKPLDKKQIIIKNTIRIAFLCVAIALIVIGIIDKQPDGVLTKATMICLECVGIG